MFRPTQVVKVDGEIIAGWLVGAGAASSNVQYFFVLLEVNEVF